MAGSHWDPTIGDFVDEPDSGGNNSNGGSSGNNNSGNNSNHNNHHNNNTVKYKKVSINLLTGELPLLPSRENLTILPGMTLDLKGFGKYLSGGYFVTGRTITLDDSSGVGMKITVTRPKFLDTVKGMSKYDD